MAFLKLPARMGPPPRTTSRLPHSQLTQHGPHEIVQKLHDWCFSLPSVRNEHSGVSVPGARAMVLPRSVCNCNPKAFMVGREFAHIHPAPDHGSMHVMVSAEDANVVKEQGWGEDHYLVTQGHFAPGLILTFSPRDDDELLVIKTIVARSYEFATGTSVDV